jgi:hypothetical protein
LVYNKRLWVIGGFDENDDALNDVWYTEDLIHWHRTTPQSQTYFRKVGYMGACVYDQRMWILGGTDYNTIYTAVYNSRDGVYWQKSFDLPKGLQQPLAAEINRRLFVFGGFTGQLGGSRDVYRLNIG